MTKELFNRFYHTRGIRTAYQLSEPEFAPLVELPKAAVLSVAYPTSMTHEPNLEIDLSQPYFAGYTKKIPVFYNLRASQRCLELKRYLQSYVLRTHVRPFFEQHRKHLEYRGALNEDAIISAPDDTTLVVVNHSHLLRVMLYTEQALTPYHVKRNYYLSVFEEISRICSILKRPHFLIIDLPQEVPSWSLTKLFGPKMDPSEANKALIEIFDSDSSMLVLDFLNWLDPEESRHLSWFSSIKPEHWPQVNLVFRNASKECAVANMAYLNSWIKGQENTTSIHSLQQLPSSTLQKHFLSFVIRASSVFNEDTQDKEFEAAMRSSVVKQPDPDDVEDADDSSIDRSGLKAKKPVNPIQKTIQAGLPDSKSLTDKELDTPSTNFAQSSVAEKEKNIEEDLKALERATQKALREKGIRIDSKGNLIEDPEESAVTDSGEIKSLPIEEIEKKWFTVKSNKERALEKIAKLADEGAYSAADYRAAIKALEASQDRPDPFDPKRKAVQTVVTPQETVLDREKLKLAVPAGDVHDPTMLECNSKARIGGYIENVLQKDIVQVINSFERAGIIIKDHAREEDHSVVGSYDLHRIEVKPLEGASSVLRFKLAQVKPDGTFVNGGNSYVQRQQRRDVPIRKIGPTEVALTSYYGKLSVKLSERVADSSVAYILKHIYKHLDEQTGVVQEAAPGKVYDGYNKAPFFFQALSAHFRMLKVRDSTWYFDHRLLDNQLLFKGARLSQPSLYKSTGIYYFGVSKEGSAVGMDDKGAIYVWTVSNKEAPVMVGTLYDILELDERNAPVDFATLSVFSKEVPMGVVLSYYMGLGNLLAYLQKHHKLQYRIVEGRKQKDLQSDEIFVAFADVSLVIKKTSTVITHLLGGLVDYQKEIKKYPVADFNHEAPYLNLLKSQNLSVIYLRELVNLSDLYLDPITIRMLQDMNEPTVYEPLLIRAVELLSTYDNPRSQDMDYQRFVGYERFAGALYKELCISTRAFRNKNFTGRSKIEMSPFAVNTSIMQDPSVKLTEEINPLQSLKQVELVTYVGNGGRNKDTMTKEVREVTVSDVGVSSEATVDSGDVGVNFCESANAQIRTMEGLTKKEDDKEYNATSMLSTAALLTPAILYDD